MTALQHIAIEAEAAKPHRFQHIYDAFDARMDAAVKSDLARQKQQRHARIRTAIREVAGNPDAAGFHRYFRCCPGGFAMSVEEGIAELTRSIRINRSLKRRNPYFPLTYHTPSLVEALTFARALRRFGARVQIARAA